jgi:glycosyltransferase involved in cell wall biosynthesis
MAHHIDRPLKIALIHAADKGSGAENCVLSLHLALLKLGHQSHLYVGYKLTDLSNINEIERVRTIPGLLRITSKLEKTFGLERLYAPGFRRLHHVIAPDTDVVHIHSLWGSSGYADIGGLPKLTKKFPCILTLHEQWLTTGHCACPFNCVRWKTGCGRCPDLSLTPKIDRDGTRLNWIRKKWALQKSSVQITTVSDWLRKVARQSPILAGKTISVVYNGIDETVFTPGSRQEAREDLNIPQDSFVVLMAGQTVEGINKGISQQAVQAINLLKHDRVLPLLIGRSAHLVSKTLFVPHIVLPFQEKSEDMARCYRSANVTLVTSEYETFGRVAAESQACGTPVIAFATGGIPEVVKDGVGGLIVPTGDTKALAMAIQRLMDDPGYCNELGSKGAAWAHATFSTREIAVRYVGQYYETIEEQKRLHHANLGNYSRI